MFGASLSSLIGAGTGPVAPTPGPEAKTYEIEGRCMLETGDEHPCLIAGVSVPRFEVIGIKPDRIGNVVTCYIDKIGIVPGFIESATPRGFVVRSTIPAVRMDRYRARVEWHNTRASEDADHRAAPRIVPKHTRVTVEFGDRLRFSATIENVSMTGAALAINAACRPFVGSFLRLGRRDAHVVRLTSTGFAAHFVEPIRRDAFNEHIVL